MLPIGKSRKARYADGLAFFHEISHFYQAAFVIQVDVLGIDMAFGMVEGNEVCIGSPFSITPALTLVTMHKLGRAPSKHVLCLSSEFGHW